MARPWSTGLENEFYIEFKMTFSKQEVFFNEQTCCLLIITLDNLQKRDKKANRDYTMAINNIHMTAIFSYISQAKTAFDKMKTSILDQSHR